MKSIHRITKEKGLEMSTKSFTSRSIGCKFDIQTILAICDPIRNNATLNDK